MKILLYYHTGSKNHGCEAIVRTLAGLFKEHELVLYSFDSQADYDFELNDIILIKQCLPCRKYTLLDKILFKIKLRQPGQECYRQMFKERPDWAISIGGDNYCYYDQPDELAYLNRKWLTKGVKTVLMGCSIDDRVLDRKEVIKDLQRYQRIVTRESITYTNLIKNGVKNVTLFPDSAFALNMEKTSNVLNCEKKWIGINVSPLILKYSKDARLVLENFYYLLDYLIKFTEYSIVLIPHVTVSWDNDFNALERLYELYKKNDRIILMQEMNCQQLKYIISQCSFVICARTHVSIAAYSLGIPTIVVGYSVKSSGIAKDIFGDENENYVVSIEQLNNCVQLCQLFQILQENEKYVKQVLLTKSEEYREKLKNLSNFLFESEY